MWNGQQVAAVIAAGGQGRRLGGETPKQFLPVAGTPVLARTMRIFQDSPVVDGIIVAARSGDMAQVRLLAEGHRITKLLDVVEGGAERQESVWNALQRLEGGGVRYVLVHDAVRPFIDEELIASVCSAAAEHGAAVPAVTPTDTVVSVNAQHQILGAHNRDQLGIVQTPQGFEFSILFEAFQVARRDGYTATDDASLVRHCGRGVWAVPGRPLNIKITTADDLRMAECIAKRAAGGSS